MAVDSFEQLLVWWVLPFEGVWRHWTVWFNRKLQNRTQWRKSYVIKTSSKVKRFDQRLTLPTQSALRSRSNCELQLRRRRVPRSIAASSCRSLLCREQSSLTTNLKSWLFLLASCSLESISAVVWQGLAFACKGTSHIHKLVLSSSGKVGIERMATAVLPCVTRISLPR